MSLGRSPMVPPRHMLHGSLQPVRSSLRNLCAALGPQEAERLFSSPTLHAASSESASPEKVLSCLLNRVAEAVGRLKLGLADAVYSLQPAGQPQLRPDPQCGPPPRLHSKQPRRPRRGRRGRSTAAAAGEATTTPKASGGLLTGAAVSIGSSSINGGPSQPPQVRWEVVQQQPSVAVTTLKSPTNRVSRQQACFEEQLQTPPPMVAVAAGACIFSAQKSPSNRVSSNSSSSGDGSGQQPPALVDRVWAEVRASLLLSGAQAEFLDASFRDHCRRSTPPAQLVELWDRWLDVWDAPAQAKEGLGNAISEWAEWRQQRKRADDAMWELA